MVEEKEIPTAPAYSLCVVWKFTYTLSLLPSLLSVFISSGVFSRSSVMWFTAVQLSVEITQCFYVPLFSVVTCLYLVLSRVITKPKRHQLACFSRGPLNRL